MRKTSRMKMLLAPITCLVGAAVVSGTNDALTSKIADLLRHLLMLVC